MSNFVLNFNGEFSSEPYECVSCDLPCLNWPY